ncbi:hypothetical protein KHC28_16580 [Ancylobacter sonchi]|uniref:hypothetical protein n=1 Tax=Ancylobacter sonchi TaxID=1937790 RepID=UPI001BD2B895|nr:hypothetical protein [Ancylobacter sonchi]MBS7535270.1 hypothetical protein [Ancylobacter sonchi]
MSLVTVRLVVTPRWWAGPANWLAFRLMRGGWPWAAEEVLLASHRFRVEPDKALARLPRRPAGSGCPTLSAPP